MKISVRKFDRWYTKELNMEILTFPMDEKVMERNKKILEQEILEDTKKKLLEQKILERKEKLVELQKETGYNIVQVKAQSIMGPPPFWTGPPPPRGCEIFIGKLPRDMFEYEIFPILSYAGLVYEFRLIMDFSGSTKGIAFATYTCREDADRAIELLNDFEVRPGEPPIGVLKSRDNRRLYISGLPMDKSKEQAEEDVFAEITKYTEGVRKVIVYSNAYDKTKNRGYAFVEYESHRAASLARKVLIPEEVKLFGMEVYVDWAAMEKTEQLDTEEQTRSVTVLYVRNIPPHINEGFLQYLFTLQGSIPVHRVKKIRDFAFVHYFSRQDAEVAFVKMNRLDVGGSHIEVTWAKPNRKCKAKYANAINIEFGVREMQDQSKIRIGKSAIKLLSTICQDKGWGEPIYHVIHTSFSADESETTFSAKVFIPNLPHPMKYFALSNTFFSPAEAKNCAAQYVLYKIAYLFNYQTPSFCSVTNNLQNSIPVSSERGKENNQTIWNSTLEIPPPVNNDSLGQNEYFWPLLESAAKLAYIELQSKWLSSSVVKPGTIDI